jgi:toxin ParE1/3/4
MKMELRWAEEAATDLEHIADYLFQRAPERAAGLLRAIYDAPTVLLSFPYRGRAGKKVGTRELVIPSLPCFVVYQVTGELTHVVRILHGAQKWP